MDRWDLIQKLMGNENTIKKESTIGPASPHSGMFRQQPPLWTGAPANAEIPREAGLDSPLIDPVDLLTTAGASMLSVSKQDAARKAIEKQMLNLEGKVDPMSAKYLRKALTSTNKEGMRDIVRGIKTDINELPEALIEEGRNVNSPIRNVIRSIYKDKDVKGEVGAGLRNFTDSGDFLKNDEYLKEYVKLDDILGNQTISSESAASAGDLNPHKILKHYGAAGGHWPKELLNNPANLGTVAERELAKTLDPNKSLIIYDSNRNPLNLQSLLYHEQAHINKKGLPTILERTRIGDAKEFKGQYDLLKEAADHPDFSGHARSVDMMEYLANKGLTSSELARINSAYHHSPDKIITPEYENLLQYLTKSTRKNAEKKVSDDVFNELSKMIPLMSLKKGDD